MGCALGKIRRLEGRERWCLAATPRPGASATSGPMGREAWGIVTADVARQATALDASRPRELPSRAASEIVHAFWIDPAREVRFGGAPGRTADSRGGCPTSRGTTVLRIGSIAALPVSQFAARSSMAKDGRFIRAAHPGAGFRRLLRRLRLGLQTHLAFLIPKLRLGMRLLTKLPPLFSLTQRSRNQGRRLGD